MIRNIVRDFLLEKKMQYFHNEAGPLLGESQINLRGAEKFMG